MTGGVETRTAVAPAVPTGQALATLRPLSLDAVALEPNGLLGRWHRLNVAATLPHCIEQLESSGALGNLRHLAGKSEEQFSGMWFADTDVHKSLEAAMWQLATGEAAAAVGPFVERTVALLAAGQVDDGYLNTWVQLVHGGHRWRDLKWGHELYCAGHLVQAGVAAARSGQSSELAEVAIRCADLVTTTFGADGREGVCGHPEIETALVELYRVTGHRPYLDVAARMIELRGRGLLALSDAVIPDRGFGAQYFQDHLPVREASQATGHAVRQLYLECGVVDVAVETRDAALLAASERIWDDLFSTKTYLTGAHGSRHRDEAIGDAYELPPDRAYAETCAAIASLHWNWRLLLATGRHRYADEMERVLHNGVAVSTAVDGEHFFYSNPLQLRPGHDGSDEDAPSQRLSWYRCACCPPNLARLVATLPAYLATTDADGVQVHLYAAATVRADVLGGSATLRMDTDYPWDGRVTITIVDCDTDEPWTLRLRVPGWCTDARVSVDGARVDTTVREGYLVLAGPWSVGRSFVLDLDMPARFIAGHPRIDAIRGCVALARGPLVYCVEQADLAADVPLEDVRIDQTVAPRTVRRKITALDVPVVISATGAVRRGDADRLYAEVAGAAGGAPPNPTKLTAIPYFRWANRAPGPMRVWLPVVDRLG